MIQVMIVRKNNITYSLCDTEKRGFTQNTPANRAEGLCNMLMEAKFGDTYTSEQKHVYEERYRSTVYEYGMLGSVSMQDIAEFQEDLLDTFGIDGFKDQTYQMVFKELSTSVLADQQKQNTRIASGQDYIR